MIGFVISEEQYKMNLKSGFTPKVIKRVPYDPDKIKERAIDYCERIFKSEEVVAGEYNLDAEALVLSIDIGMLKSYADTNLYPNCKGLMAVLCLDDKNGINQSVVLVPYEEVDDLDEDQNKQFSADGKVLKKPSAIVRVGTSLVVGMEQWPTLDLSKLSLFEDQNGDFDSGKVIQLMNDLKIKK